MGLITGDAVSADWAALGKIPFTRLEHIEDFAEGGRVIAGESADILDQALAALRDALLNTPWLGGKSAENKARVRKLLRPLGWTAHHGLPAARRRFVGL